MNHLTDDELVEGYRSTSKQEFIATLFMRYSDASYRTALRFTGNIADAEDAVQISFIKFLRDFSQFQQGTNVRAWLMKIIVNTCKDKYREDKRRSARHEKFSMQKEKSKVDDDFVEKEELQFIVKKSVAMLPEKYKTPICMVMYEGFTYPEVATVLALPEKTIRTQVARGMSKLRETLGSLGHVLSLDTIAVTMTQTSLEVAPAKLKSLISAPELYQISSENIAGESRRVLMVPKTTSTFTFFKAFLVVFIGGLGVIAGYYILNPTKPAIVPQTTLATVPLVKVEDTNRTWAFINESDRKLKLLFGEWEWSEALKAMKMPTHKAIIISLPIQAQEKAFALEGEMKPAASQLNVHLELLFTGYWAINQNLLKHEIYLKKNKYRLIQNTQSQKIYFYKNYICIFINNECIQINKCIEDNSTANPVIAAANLYFKKISSRTFQEPPEELLRAIKNNANEKPTDIQSNFKIDQRLFFLDKN